MANLGFTLMAVIAAAVTLASCDTQPRSLFADEPAASSPAQLNEGTEKGS
jgi:hypothetical protein